MNVVSFMRGRSLYQIVASKVPAEGYVGLRDGRVVVRGLDRPSVVRALVQGAT